MLDDVSTDSTAAGQSWLERGARHHLPLHADLRIMVEPVETSFGILSRKAVRRGSFGSVTELITVIDALTHR